MNDKHNYSNAFLMFSLELEHLEENILLPISRAVVECMENFDEAHLNHLFKLVEEGSAPIHDFIKGFRAYFSYYPDQVTKDEMKILNERVTELADNLSFEMSSILSVYEDAMFNAKLFIENIDEELITS